MAAAERNNYDNARKARRSRPQGMKGENVARGMLTVKRGALCAMILVLLAGALLAAGCGPAGKAQKAPEWVKTEIYLGSSVPGGKTVTAEEYADFLNTVVTKEFPAGVTVFDAYGQMQRTDGSITKQDTRVVLLVHEDTAANTEAVKRVVDEYRKRFNNAQVMKTSSPTDVEFFNN